MKDIVLRDLTMQDMVYQAAIDVVTGKLGAPVQEAAFGCKWDKVELLYIGGTITLATTSDSGNKYIINKITDVDIFLASVIPQETWHELTVSDFDLRFWVSRQLDACNIKYTKNLRTYRIYCTHEMYSMILDYVKRISSITTSSVIKEWNESNR